MNKRDKGVIQMFHALTDIEIKASLDAGKGIEHYTGMADIYILAVNRCRQLLEIILEGTSHE
jgi:hypothetical protein